jgi:hypothetical protein
VRYGAGGDKIDQRSLKIKLYLLTLNALAAEELTVKPHMVTEGGERDDMGVREEGSPRGREDRLLSPGVPG